MAERPPHPAQYTPSILDAIEARLVAEELPVGARVFDPFAGLGDHAAAMCSAHEWQFVGTEIEVWANVVQGDATALPFRDGCMDAAITSVTYGNGLADAALDWSDPTGRRTYDLFLGAPLRATNTGRCGLRGRGEKGYGRYLELHGAAFAELFRVLAPGAPFVLNCSDVVAGGSMQPVTADNVAVAVRAGFRVERWEAVGTPRYGRGANAALRAPAEDVVTLRRPM